MSDRDSSDGDHKVNEQLDEMLTVNHSEDDSRSDEEDDTPRSVYCTARCTMGCKRCLCSNGGYPCDTSDCRCNNCNNLETLIDPLAKWITADVAPIHPVFDQSKAGPRGIENGHEKTENYIVPSPVGYRCLESYYSSNKCI